MKAHHTTRPRPIAVVFDSSASFSFGKNDWALLGKHTVSGKIQVWDSVIGLIETIRHMHQPDCRLKEKAKWVANRCAHFEEIAPKHMIPHPGMVVRLAVREWLKWPRSESEIMEETGLYLGLRKALAQGHKAPDAADVVQHLIEPTNKISEDFKANLDGLRAEMKADYVDKVRESVEETPGRFRNMLTEHIQKDADWQRTLFLNMMHHHNVSESERAAIALEWQKIPFVRALMSIYCLQIGRFVDSDRPSVIEDFIDFEWGAYIASDRVGLFVTNNTRDFQQAFLDVPEISKKIRTWEEFKKELDS